MYVLPARVWEVLTHGTERAFIRSHLRPSRGHLSTRPRLQLARKHLLLWVSRHGNSKRMAYDQGAGGQVRRRLSRLLGDHSLPHVSLPQLRWSGHREVFPGCLRSGCTSLYDAAQPYVVSERRATSTDCLLVQHFCWCLRWYSILCDRWH